MNNLMILCKAAWHSLLLMLFVSVATADEPTTTACPSDFYKVAIPEGGKLCQIFATDMPASMVFFVPQDPQSVISFYANDSQFKPAEPSKERFIIRSTDDNVSIIVSADGAGTQVDVLVIEETE